MTTFIEFAKLFAAFASGGFAHYLVKRFLERRGIVEGQNRDRRNIENANALLDAHIKAVEADVNVFMPLEHVWIEPAEEDDRSERILDMAYGLLSTTLFHSLQFERLARKYPELSTEREEVRSCFIECYGGLNSLVSERSDSLEFTQLVHSYFNFLTQQNQANEEAYAAALGKYVVKVGEDKIDNFASDPGSSSRFVDDE